MFIVIHLQPKKTRKSDLANVGIYWLRCFCSDGFTFHLLR